MSASIHLTLANRRRTRAASAVALASLVAASCLVRIPDLADEAGDGAQDASPGVVADIPGTIQAEDFDNGGEGVAYHDTDAVNQCDANYRPGEGVDIKTCSDIGGGYAVGWTVAGEWVNYTVNVTAGGPYTLRARVATPESGISFHVEIDGIDVTGALAVPVTGAWDTAWASVVKNGVSLTQGKHVLKVVFDTGNMDLNFIELSRGCDTTADCGVAMVCKSNQCTSCIDGVDDALCGSGRRCADGQCVEAATTTIDDLDPAFQWSTGPGGYWNDGACTNGTPSGGCHWDSGPGGDGMGVAGDAVELSFTGSRFDLWLCKGSLGIADIYVDGSLVTSIDTYLGGLATSDECQGVVTPVVRTLPPGVHTLKVVNTGTKNPASLYTSIEIDRVIVYP